MYALEVIVAQNKVGDARAKTTPLSKQYGKGWHYLEYDYNRDRLIKYLRGNEAYWINDEDCWDSFDGYDINTWFIGTGEPGIVTVTLYQLREDECGNIEADMSKRIDSFRMNIKTYEVFEKKRYTVEVVSNETEYWEVEAESKQEALDNYMNGEHKYSKFHGDDVCVIKEKDCV